MKIIFSLILGLLQVSAFTQVVATFEDFNLDRGSYINDASPLRYFESGSIQLPNYYDTQFSFWSGFAISADTNTTSPGFLNQYSSIAGTGASGTSTYAMGYIYQPTFIHLKDKAIGKPMIGMYVNNSTYAYLSMRDGDAFAKKFGGETGKDPDFFMLTIKKYAGGVISDDSINVYLADYRSQDASKDYILSEWTYVDLTTLGSVDSVIVSLSSSDVGAFGMNTPAYVCFDQISTDNLLSAASLNGSGTELTINPNPVRETLYLELPSKTTYSISNIHGVVFWSQVLDEGWQEIGVSTFPPGMYFITMGNRIAGKFVIE